MQAFTREAFVRARREWLAATNVVVALGGFVPAMLCAVAALFPRGSHGVVLPALFVVAYYAVLLGTAFAWHRWRREEHGRLRADEGGVWLGECRITTRREVRVGYVARIEGRSFVRLLKRGVIASAVLVRKRNQDVSQWASSRRSAWRRLRSPPTAVARCLPSSRSRSAPSPSS